MSSERNQLYDTAALWVLRQEDPEWCEQQQAELESWLAASPDHRVAFLRQREGWRAADRIAALDLSLDDFPEHRSNSYRQLSIWTKLAASVVVALISGLVLVSLNNWSQRDMLGAHPASSTTFVPQHTYATALGGHAVMPLSDGSRLELDTMTSVRTAVSSRKREVWLDKGEVFFEIAHRDGQPFVVHAGDRKVTVLGTKFAVRRDGERITVAVLEGRVRLDDVSRPKSTHAALLSSGDMAIAIKSSTLVSVNVPDRVDRALAWREGMLNFTNARLSDVAAEFNRYNARKLVMADRATGEVRIDGAFQTTNVERFARLLELAYGMRVRQTDDTIKISQ